MAPSSAGPTRSSHSTIRTPAGSNKISKSSGRLADAWSHKRSTTPIRIPRPARRTPRRKRTVNAVFTIDGEQVDVVDISGLGARVIAALAKTPSASTRLNPSGSRGHPTAVRGIDRLGSVRASVGRWRLLSRGSGVSQSRPRGPRTVLPRTLDSGSEDSGPQTVRAVSIAAN